jgi:hypothetical protein
MSKLPSRNRLTLEAAIAAFLGAGALQLSGDWRVDSVIVAATVAGVVFRAFPDRDRDGIPDVAERIIDRRRGA